MKARFVALQGLFVAAALLLSFVESLIPPVLPALPGVKLGLANLATLISLMSFGPLPALGVACGRIMLSALMFSGISSLPYALSGGLLAWMGMALAQRFLGLGPPGVSLCGGILHNLGQIAVACMLFQTTVFFAYLPHLILAGCITGFVLGLIALECQKRLRSVFGKAEQS